MARERRTRRDVLLDIDTGGIDEALSSLGLMWSEKESRKLIRTAWNVALKRTGITLRRRALNEVKTAISPRSPAMMRRRLLPPFRLQSETGLDEMKVWFGLNKIKVRDLKGRITGKSPRHKLRDAQTGRFIPATARSSRSHALTFTPAGDMPAVSYPGAFRGRIRNKKTILMRGASGRLNEADVPVYDVLADRIEDNVFADASQIMLKNFMHELRFRAGRR